MALGRTASDGFRRLDAITTVVSGGTPDETSLAFLPILRPYTLYAVLRITTTTATTMDVSITWQAQPKLADAQEVGAIVGGTPGDKPT